MTSGPTRSSLYIAQFASRRRIYWSRDPVHSLQPSLHICKVGDKVDIVWTEALLVSLEPGK